MKRITKTIILSILLLFCSAAVFAEGGYLQVGEERLPIYTLQKAGNDNENFVMLLFGDGYTASEQDKFLSDISLRARAILKVEPFCTYSDKINIYAVPTVSAETGVSVDEGEQKDTYFELEHYGNVVSISMKGEQKARAIAAAMERNYLDSGAVIGTIHILSNSPKRFGTSTSAMFSYSSMTDDCRGGETFIHEVAHSIGRIRDEYGMMPESVNTSKQGGFDNIAWKKMLGFRNVDSVLNDQGSYGYVPSDECSMRNEGYVFFCEVCRLEIAKRLNSPYRTQYPEKYYIANPDLTIEHEPTSNMDEYKRKYRVINGNLKKANGHSLEFRTIVQNLSYTEKRLKLSLRIIDVDGNNRFFKQEEFTVPALPKNALYEHEYEPAKQSLSVVIDNISGIDYRDKVIGEVIDCETNEVVATDKDAYTDKAEIKINHKLKNSDGTIVPMPNTAQTCVYAFVGANYRPKTLKRLNGYVYVGNSIGGGEIKVDANGAEIDFYYTEPPVKAKFSADGKEIEIVANDVPQGNCIILALYNGDTLSEVKSFTYNGGRMNYTPTKEYSSLKIMVWKTLFGMEPEYMAEFANK